MLGLGEGCSERGDPGWLLAGSPKEEKEEEDSQGSTGSCRIPARGSAGGTMGTSLPWSMGLAKHCAMPSCAHGWAELGPCSPLLGCTTLPVWLLALLAAQEPGSEAAVHAAGSIREQRSCPYSPGERSLVERRNSCSFVCLTGACSIFNPG